MTMKYTMTLTFSVDVTIEDGHSFPEGLLNQIRSALVSDFEHSATAVGKMSDVRCCGSLAVATLSGGSQDGEG